MFPNTHVGTVDGTGAAINVVCGFKPDYVEVVNVEDGTRIDKWFRGTMPEGSSIAIIAAAGPVLNADNGISSYAGPTGEGFTIGTDISTNGKTLAFVAMRSAPGAH
jgi:hypothetical protein